jgi:hypothetical protein
MGGLTGVTVRRSRDPQSDRRRPLRVGIRRREVAVDRFVTEVVMGHGDIVGSRTPPLLSVLPASAVPVAAPRLPEAA